MDRMYSVLTNVQLMRHLVDMAEQRLQGGFWTVDLPARTTFWSAGMYQMFKLDAGSFTPSYSSINDLTHPQDRRSAAELETVFSAGIAYDRSQRIVASDGQFRTIAARVEFEHGREGRPTRMVGILFDVSQLFELNALLEANRRRFNVLVETLTLLSWTSRPDGRVELIRGWEDLTGEPADLALGDNWINRVHPEDRERVMAAWRRSVETGEPYDERVRIMMRNDRSVLLRATARPVRAADGAIVEWLGSTTIVHDEALTGAVVERLITGAQIRAARGLLNWSVSRLSEASRVPSSTIRRLETFDGAFRKPDPALEAIRSVLEIGGATFVFAPDGKPGVRPA